MEQQIEKKISTGVRLSKNIVTELDDIVKNLVDLGVTRSELINFVLYSYLKSKKDEQTKLEQTRSLIIQKRKGLI